MRDGGDDGRDDDDLRNNHRRGGEQEPQHPKRPCPRQKDVDDQADHHRRQAHQRVEKRDHHAPEAEAVHRQPGTQWKADQSRDCRCRQCDLKGADGDLDKIGIEPQHQPQRLCQSCP